MLRDIDLFTHTDSVISSIRTEDVYRHMCVCVCVSVSVWQMKMRRGSSLDGHGGTDGQHRLKIA